MSAKCQWVMIYTINLFFAIFSVIFFIQVYFISMSPSFRVLMTVEQVLAVVLRHHKGLYSNLSRLHLINQYQFKVIIYIILRLSSCFKLIKTDKVKETKFTVELYNHT